MYDVWKRNTMNNHALTSVPLSKASEATLSETVTQYVTTEEVTVDDRSVERRVLPQVTYMFPAVPKKKVRRMPRLSFPGPPACRHPPFHHAWQ